MVTGTPTTTILALDSGSSSLKFAVYEVHENGERQIIEGAAEGIASPSPTFWAKRDPGEVAKTEALSGDALSQVLTLLEKEAIAFDMVVHRIVFGGADRDAVERVDDHMMSQLRSLQTFDSLHLPVQIHELEAIGKAYPSMVQYACFDTAFHAGMPDIAKRLPIPRSLHNEGVRRFGYHGLSYASILAQLDADTVAGRVLIAHLGSGCSMAAIHGGSPVDTTMGFTPLGGFMMGTRPGDLDPGVLLHLLRDGRYSLASLEHLLENDCGLRGVSGATGNMHSLLSQPDDAAAAEAISLFAYLAAKAAGSLVVAMGGLNTFVFTGGIGERSAIIRERIAGYLTCFGLALDDRRNCESYTAISDRASVVEVFVLPSRETRAMARLASDANIKDTMPR
ncbi:MAG: acetate/propionate family kinase [Candidatus Acidiferrales bacterium]